MAETTIVLGDETVTEVTPTMELRWELQNPEGVRTRRWCLTQKHIITTYRRIANNGRTIADNAKEEWRPVPIAMPPDEIMNYSRAHAGFVPRSLDIVGDLQ